MSTIETPDMTPTELVLKRAKQSPYSVPEIELVLRTVAYQAGNVSAALRIVNAHRKEPIRAPTVRHWIERTYRERYEEILMAELQDVQQRQGIRALELAAEAQDVTADLVDRTRKAAKKGQIEPKDLAPAARNMSQVFGTTVEKGLQLSGQPTQRVSVDSLPELVTELRSMLGSEPVDGEAEEVDE